MPYQPPVGLAIVPAELAARLDGARGVHQQPGQTRRRHVYRQGALLRQHAVALGRAARRVVHVPGHARDRRVCGVDDEAAAGRVLHADGIGGAAIVVRLRDDLATVVEQVYVLVDPNVGKEPKAFGLRRDAHSEPSVLQEAACCTRDGSSPHGHLSAAEDR
eukprot:scaffold79656_cov60-Phaeocystis_antarctica.AAC.8